MSDQTNKCHCTGYSEYRGGGYYEHMIDPEPDCPTHGELITKSGNAVPQRIQRKRTKGWRAPEGAIYVGRGSRWGNPFAVGKTQIRMPALNGGEWEHEGRLHKTSGQQEFFCTGANDEGHPIGVWHQIEDATPEQCVTLYREYLAGEGEHLGWTLKRSPAELRDAIRSELRGKTLMCWCPVDQACHADVLLELANQEV